MNSERVVSGESRIVGTNLKVSGFIDNSALTIHKIKMPLRIREMALHKTSFPG